MSLPEKCKMTGDGATVGGGGIERLGIEPYSWNTVCINPAPPGASAALCTPRIHRITCAHKWCCKAHTNDGYHGLHCLPACPHVSAAKNSLLARSLTMAACVDDAAVLSGGIARAGGRLFDNQRHQPLPHCLPRATWFRCLLQPQVAEPPPGEGHRIHTGS